MIFTHQGLGLVGMLDSVDYEACLNFGGIFPLEIEIFFSPDNVIIATWIESISLCSSGRFSSLGFGYILYVKFCRLWSVGKCWMYLSSFCLRGNQDIGRSTWVDWLLCGGIELPMTIWRLCPPSFGLQLWFFSGLPEMHQFWSNPSSRCVNILLTLICATFGIGFEDRLGWISFLRTKCRGF